MEKFSSDNFFEQLERRLLFWYYKIGYEVLHTNIHRVLIYINIMLPHFMGTKKENEKKAWKEQRNKRFFFTCRHKRAIQSAKNHSFPALHSLTQSDRCVLFHVFAWRAYFFSIFYYKILIILIFSISLSSKKRSGGLLITSK